MRSGIARESLAADTVSMPWWDRLIERRILKARAEGQLEGLPGEGAPLPDRAGDTMVDPGLAAGYRIMAENGVLPEEFHLRKEIAAVKAELQTLTDPDARKAAMARFADLQMRLSIAEEARRKFHRG